MAHCPPRIGPVALASAVLLLPPPVAGVPEPRAALLDYYAAVDSGDCARAAALRPGYAQSACAAIAGTRVLAATIIAREAGRAVLSLSVTVDKRDGPTQRFNGQVGMRRCGDQWYVPSWAFSNAGGSDFTERFLNGSLDHSTDFCASTVPVPAAADVVASPEAPPVPDPAPAAVAHGTVTVGSPYLLARCWTDADLAALPHEAELTTATAPLPPLRRQPAVDRWSGTAQPPFMNLRFVRPAGGARLVALTFNLIERPGEVAGYDTDLVQALRSARAPATLFASGRWMQSHPERTRQLMADPLFELGSLGWDHRNMIFPEPNEALRQWRLADAVYHQLRWDLSHRRCTADARGREEMAHIPALPTLLRFPYGRCDRSALAVAATAGLPIVQWSLVLDDIAHGSSIESMRTRVRDDLARRGPGLIVVGHADGRGRHTAAVVRLLLADLSADGYQPVTVSTLLSAGEPVAYPACFEHRPGDNLDYDDRFSD
ncbi:polysaccharide deacetylase family protein [uncultured Thiohalocapsa sp.]|uniref:polysaccharide deacetylase family protein n=1 Tax=uncultured Thiohalocapsa sp. TaxID=768990 RepID=UPI0025E0758D|nr:polysaccharide deacetylase family protein [uncultured Thiohalocapsa sp.]